MGIDLFTHSVRLVWNNRPIALRISAILYLIYAVPTLLLVPEGNVRDMSPGVALWSGLSGLLFVICFLWVAVAWHRYILLNEVPAGLLPAFNGGRMLAYLGYSLLIGIVLLAVGLLAWLVVGLLIAIVPGLAPAIGIVVVVISYVLLLIASYRLSPMLPAAAVGKSITMGLAWNATKGTGGTIVILAIVSVIAALVIDIPAYLLGLLGTPGVFLAHVWTLGTGWLKLMVGVSILTTLYGVYIEHRQLPPR